MADYQEVTLEEFLSAASTVPPELYQYYKGLEDRRIIISDAIGGEIVERAIIPLLGMDKDGSGKPIEIMLSSPGGSVMDAMVLCDVIDKLQTPTTITVLGYAYSMGSLILMAGYNNPNVKKVCYPFSTALMHAGSAYLDGAAFSVKDAFQFGERFDEKIKEYTLSHTKITAEEYDKMERYEWYLLAEDMLRLGLVDEVL